MSDRTALTIIGWSVVCYVTCFLLAHGIARLVLWWRARRKG